MPNYRKRVEELEKWAHKKRPSADTEPAAARALRHLSDEHLNLLRARLAAELEKREPTESEAAAQVAYQAALDQELQRTNQVSTTKRESMKQPAESAEKARPEPNQFLAGKPIRPLESHTANRFDWPGQQSDHKIEFRDEERKP